jgi:hypothetical protein
MDILLLRYGFHTGGDPTNEELGNKLVTVPNPTFPNVGGALINTVNLTIPTGFTGQVNLTCGIFYTLGVSFIVNCSEIVLLFTI